MNEHLFRTRDETVPLPGDTTILRTPLIIGSLQIPIVDQIHGPVLPVEIR